MLGQIIRQDLGIVVQDFQGTPLKRLAYPRKVANLQILALAFKDRRSKIRNVRPYLCILSLRVCF